MAHIKTLRGALALTLLIGGTSPLFAQGLLDRMKEDAARRAENKAVMEAEHPADTQAAATPAAAAPAATPAPAAPAPATPAPAAPATPAPAQ